MDEIQKSGHLIKKTLITFVMLFLQNIKCFKSCVWEWNFGEKGKEIVYFGCNDLYQFCQPLAKKRKNIQIAY